MNVQTTPIGDTRFESDYAILPNTLAARSYLERRRYRWAITDGARTIRAVLRQRYAGVETCNNLFRASGTEFGAHGLDQYGFYGKGGAL